MFKKVLSSSLIIAESALVFQIPCVAEELKQKVTVGSPEGNAVNKVDEKNGEDMVVKVEINVVGGDDSSRKKENKKPWYRFGFVPGWVKEVIAEIDLFFCTITLISAVFLRKNLPNILRERLVPGNPENV